MRIRRQDNTGRLWKPGARAVICSEHFLQSDFFWQWGRKLIKPDAEPTVFSFSSASVPRRWPPPYRTVPPDVAQECEVCASDDAMSTVSVESVSDTSFSPRSEGDHTFLCIVSPRKLTSKVNKLVEHQ